MNSRVAKACVLVGVVALVVGTSAWPAVAAPTTWSMVAVPESTGGLNVLTAVSCATPTFCVAVGTRSTTSGSFTTTVPVIREWDGSNWSSVSSPAGNGLLFGVSCTAATFCVAVGAGSPFGNPMVDLWDGTNWSAASTPSTTGVLYSVSCSSATFCVAAGGAPGGSQVLVEIWNGASWSIASTPNPGTTAVLHGVSCTSPSTCEAVGSYGAGVAVTETTLVETWDGSSWSLAASPNPDANGDALNGVSCVSAADCVAVGHTTGSSLVESWDGSSWSVASTADANTVLQGVSCESGTDCVAVGYTNIASPASVDTHLETFDGSGWSTSAVPDPGKVSNQLTGVSCTATAACVSVGSFRNRNVTPQVGSFLGLVGSTPGTTVSVGDATILEGNAGSRTLEFAVTLSQPATQPVSVGYTLTGTSATGGPRPGPGVDFNDRGGETGTVAFPVGSSGTTAVEKFVAVKVYGDTADEGDEQFHVTLSNPSAGYQLGRSLGTGTIVDDDPGSGVTMGVGDAAIFTAAAGAQHLVFPVDLSAAVGAFSVGYTVTAGSATYAKTAAAGGDYGGKTTGTLTFSDTSTRRSISIPIWPHPTPAADETFTVSLGTPSNPTIAVVRPTGIGTILSH